MAIDEPRPRTAESSGALGVTTSTLGASSAVAAGLVLRTPGRSEGSASEFEPPRPAAPPAFRGDAAPLDSSAEDVWAERGPVRPEVAEFDFDDDGEESADGEESDDGPDESGPLAEAEPFDEPEDPSDPELSACARPGIANMPEPTPSATASAPTRPTVHAEPGSTFSK